MRRVARDASRVDEAVAAHHSAQRGARVTNASRCARRVVVPSSGRLGNHLFVIYACYGIARHHNLCLRATATTCAAFDFANYTDVACPGEPGLPGHAPQVHLKLSRAWWAHEDGRRVIPAEKRPRVDFQCLGYRQNARAVDAAGVVFPWKAKVAARGKALYENTTRGLGADKVVWRSTTASRRASGSTKSVCRGGRSMRGARGSLSKPYSRTAPSRISRHPTSSGTRRRSQASSARTSEPSTTGSRPSSWPR